MSVCETCDTDPEAVTETVTPRGRVVRTSGHGCHCVHENGQRVAVGICCGRTIGAEMLADEEASDARRSARRQ